MKIINAMYSDDFWHPYACNKYKNLTPQDTQKDTCESVNIYYKFQS